MSTSSGGETTPFRTVGVIGAGLVGSSLARAAGALPGVERIVLTDHSSQVRAVVAEMGVGELLPGAVEVAAEADLVVIAVPVDHVAAIAEQLPAGLGAGTVVTDVGSVKARVVEDVLAALGEAHHSCYVGGHPMAGSEASGPGASDPDLFQGATWVLTPTEVTDPAAFNRLGTFLRQLGARVLAVEPETHDRLVAVTSHLPQALASVLMAHADELAEDEPGLLAVAGSGFRDATRVAASDPELWVGILRENREAVSEALSAFRRSLDELAAALSAQDWEAVRGVLAGGRAGRQRLASKPVTRDVVDLVVPVADRPGALAEVTTALGAAGVNIEDLWVRHAETGDRGALVIAVAGAEAARRAQQVLAPRGYNAHVEDR